MTQDANGHEIEKVADFRDAGVCGRCGRPCQSCTTKEQRGEFVRASIAEAHAQARQAKQHVRTLLARIGELEMHIKTLTETGLAPVNDSRLRKKVNHILKSHSVVPVQTSSARRLYREQKPIRETGDGREG